MSGPAVRPIGAGGIRALYFAYFAFIGIYSPYLSLWFDARGLSIPEIALLMSLPQALRIVAPPCWGWLADRGGRRVELLRASAIASLGVLLLFPHAGGTASLAALMLALFFLTAAQMPIGEAIALDLSGGDSGRYGRLRLWGSVGFVLAVVGGGPVLAALGLDALPWMMAAAMAGLAAVTLSLPRVAPARAVRASTPVAARLREPAVAAFMASAFLMIFAHAGLYSFYSLFLERQGWGTTAIGLIWGVGVVAEIALFTGQRLLFDRFPPLALLGASFAVCALRFAMVAGSEGSLAVLLGAQLMHAVTFGLHHSASMAVLHRWFEPAQQARAQAAFIVVGYGLGGSAGGLASGWLWERVSPEATFLGASAAALAGWGAVWLAARLAARRGDGDGRVVR
ncbi:MAG TPA: MFS transporter [Burkholderiaceae bacterium]|nr:MFS transporter [Burkholderiaceae bacterium]